MLKHQLSGFLCPPQSIRFKQSSTLSGHQSHQHKSKLCKGHPLPFFSQASLPSSTMLLLVLGDFVTKETSLTLILCKICKFNLIISDQNRLPCPNAKSSFNCGQLNFLEPECPHSYNKGRLYIGLWVKEYLWNHYGGVGNGDS